MKYRKKPVVIEAFKFDGDLMNKKGRYYVPDWAVKAYQDGVLFFDSVDFDSISCDLFIKTLEGIHHASIGNYIIKGIKGELYSCDPDIFEETYEKVEE
jgi:hypothetical protein